MALEASSPAPWPLTNSDMRSWIAPSAVMSKRCWSSRVWRSLEMTLNGRWSMVDRSVIASGEVVLAGNHSHDT